MGHHTEQVIAMLGEQINDPQRESIRKVSALTRHGYAYIDLSFRVEGVDYRIEADWLANLLNPRGPAPQGETPNTSQGGSNVR